MLILTKYERIGKWPLLALVVLFFFLIAGNSTASQIVLTDKERTFINNHPVVKLGVGASFDPFVIQNIDGSFSGHDIDILELVSEHTGLQFSFEIGPWVDIQSRAIEREVDGLLTAMNTEERARYFNNK